MRHVANLSQDEREALFIVTARETNLPEAMIEKDFWVCWALDYLFHDCTWADNLAFKGGTSLSKCFKLIQRFSEDIDIILDWRVLGYKENEPWNERSRTKQDKFNRDANARTEAFLVNKFLPQLKADFSHLLKNEFSLYIDCDDPQTVCFAYPRIFSEDALISVVRLEIGALAAWTPVQNVQVESYAAQRYSSIFKTQSTQIRTVSPERTFWEKATILHKEAFRNNGVIPPRYSRHYYDLYCMDKSFVKERAFADMELLERVVCFKDRFYHTGSAHYDLARPGTMQLMPPADALPKLKKDYTHMKNMIFGTQPGFQEIMNCIQALEQKINRTAR